MTPFEIMGGATKIATVGTTQAGEDHAALADLFSKDLHRVDHSRVSIRHLDLWLSEQPAHEGDTLLPADMVPVLFQNLVRENRTIRAKDDLCPW